MLNDSHKRSLSAQSSIRYLEILRLYQHNWSISPQILYRFGFDFTEMIVGLGVSLAHFRLVIEVFGNHSVTSVSCG